MSHASSVLVEAMELSRVFQRGGVNVQAVKSATFRIGVGDEIVIVGRSGSGKSSLLHLIAGLDAPTGGSIAWPALGERDRLRPAKIAMVLQSPSLVPSLNVLENVMLPLALMGVRGDTSDQAMPALHRFGLEGLARKLPEELSGGQAQRVALARALIVHPRLVIADEPTGQLDRATGGALIDALLEWSRHAHAAVVIATHDPEIAERVSRCWHMDHGVLTPETEDVLT